MEILASTISLTGFCLSTFFRYTNSATIGKGDGILELHILGNQADMKPKAVPVVLPRPTALQKAMINVE